MTTPRPKTIICRYQVQKRRRIAVDCSPCGRCSYCVKAAARGALPPPPGLDAEPDHGLVMLPTALRPAPREPEPALPEPLDDGEPEDEPAPAKPLRNDPKADWAAYVACVYSMDRDAVTAMTKAALIEYVRAHPRD